ncbi:MULTISPECIES: histidine kinase [Raoultella]|jgi:signal transduction protein PmrD|uniref:Histidine kinase n=1 Tax=Raoultella terrigena TaxID=577 RepID=A0A6D1SCB1_RAOTE|nr:histidine kinase [Raoultella terrigena]AJF73986.1 histidine kinase [Raoultella ornithinolytica]MCE9899804.1 histidine kinase [Raoultella terrigena]MEB7598219.1 histidine kinase [Raoultella terrigena]MEB8192456.1 histidine kinase [Raoultella terrigena]NWK87385.1 histidine kinase [Raoultella terrigena]
MEWWVKKVCTETTRVVLQSGQLLIIAEIEPCRCGLKIGDKLTPLANARYSINDDPAVTLKVQKATHFSAERWADSAHSVAE